MDGQLLAHCGSNKLTREQLALIPSPEGTDTYLEMILLNTPNPEERQAV